MPQSDMYPEFAAEDNWTLFGIGYITNRKWFKYRNRQVLNLFK